MASPIGPLPPDQDRGKAMLESLWIQTAIAAVVLGCRFYARTRIVKKLSVDDHFMMLSFIFATISGAIISRAVTFGFGRHIFFLAPHDQTEAVKLAYLAQPFNSMAQCFGRMSFAFFLVKVMGVTRTRRFLLYMIIILQFVVNVTFCGLLLGSCRPINKYWSPMTPGKCWSPLVIEYAGYVQGAFNVFTDFVLAVAPGIVIWKLNMKLRTKIGLVVLLALGIFNMIAAIVTMVETKAIAANQDITYNYVVLDIWGQVQTYVVIVVASIPTIRPLFRDSGLFSTSFFHSLFSKRSNQSHEIGSHSFRSPKRMGYTEGSDVSQRDVPAYPPTSSQEEMFPIKAPQDIYKSTNISVSHSASRREHQHFG